MTTNRPAGGSSVDRGRSIDRDGVVRIDLRQGGREKWPWIVGLFAVMASVALALRIGDGLGSGGRPYREDRQSTTRRTGSGESGRSLRGVVPRAAALMKEAVASAPDEAPDELDANPGFPNERTGLRPEDDQEPQEQERTGVRLFPAPGTKLIKRGILVPDGFELPPGYVRHFQATDKGQMLQAILMFHPDYKPLDSVGNPVPLPEDRIVPSEMAPPGLPIDYLEVPKDAYADREGVDRSNEEGGSDPEP